MVKKLSPEEEYDMSHDDDEEEFDEEELDYSDPYNMNHDDDDEDYEGDNEDYGNGEGSAYSLDHVLIDIAEYRKTHNLNPIELRQNLFEQELRTLAQTRGVSFDNLILSSTEDDINYNTMLIAMYPAMAKHMTNSRDTSNRLLLIELLREALTNLNEPTTQREKLQETPEETPTHKEVSSIVDLEPEIESNTMRVLAVYKELFEVGYELQVPYGVLTKEGSLTLKNNKTYLRETTSLAKIYEIINDITNKSLVQSQIQPGVEAHQLRSVNMRKGTTYYPEFQLGNLFGVLGDKRVDSWSELERHLEPEIKQNIRENLKSGQDITHIVDALTTCIVISEFNPKSAIRLRINVGNSLINKNHFMREYANRKSTIMAGMGELYHCEMTKAGVLEVILVFNEAAFNGRPLFAYEAVENQLARGRKPSLSNMILGQDTSGKILTANLDTQQACIILVGAGQRSGKGVLTLNLLGTVLSEGNPLIYLDGKPDMAPVLWSVGQKYGVNPAVWDLFTPNGNIEGVGAPDIVKTENPGVFGTLMYFKALQLMMVAASLQAKDMKFLDGKRPFFVFDEALAVQMTMSDTWKQLVRIAKDKNADPDEKAWCERIVSWGESLESSLPAIINSQLPKSGISTVWLFQSMQPTSWNQYAIQGITTKMNIMKKPIESRLSIKLLGRGTSDSEYALGSQKVKENKIVSTRVLQDGGRHFAMTGSQKITDVEALKIFKPYLVLNESENGTKSAEELKKNLSQEVLRVVAPEGELHPGVGFEGFAKMLGEQAIQNLAQGRLYLEAVMRAVGLMDNYETVDDYLYDASPESFKTLGELVNSTSETEDDTSEGFVYNPTQQDTSEDENQDTENTFQTNQGVENQNSNFFDGQRDTTNQETPGFDYMPDEETNNTINNVPYDRQGEETQENSYQSQHPNQNQQNHQTREADVRNSPYKSPNQQHNYSNEYTNTIPMPINPFKQLSRTQGTLSTLKAISQMSEILMIEVNKLVGDPSRVYSMEITRTGLVINDIAFRPRFDPEIVDTMPYDIKIQVQKGNIIDLFHFSNLSRFTNLEVLRVDNVSIAEGRIRRELPHSPKRDWYQLFKRFRNLQELFIGGVRIFDKGSAQAYANSGKQGYDLTEKLRETFKMPISTISNSPMDRVWHSKPVRVFGKALGWTAGVKVVAIAASMFGPWGLLFGAFAGYTALQDSKNRQQQSYSHQINQDESKEEPPSRSKKPKK